jgi:hypothetical protein
MSLPSAEDEHRLVDAHSLDSRMFVGARLALHTAAWPRSGNAGGDSFRLVTRLVAPRLNSPSLSFLFLCTHYYSLHRAPHTCA